MKKHKSTLSNLSKKQFRELDKFMMGALNGGTEVHWQCEIPMNASSNQVVIENVHKNKHNK